MIVEMLTRVMIQKKQVESSKKQNAHMENAAEYSVRNSEKAKVVFERMD